MGEQSAREAFSPGSGSCRPSRLSRIVPIYEVGERDGSCYFSMKFVEGGQLDEVARARADADPKAAELIARVARTVHYAHEHGILHRHIKPGNILIYYQANRI